MTKAFSPGHITCFFSPVRTDDIMTTGSVGAGIRLNKGTFVTLEERRDEKIVTIMDGTVYDARISEHVIRSMAPGRGFDVIIENELPVSQGMGMSAAGAIAAGLCVSSITGMSEHEAYRAAHISEIVNGGGLGDVAGITGGRQPIRVRAGIPPYGLVTDSELELDVTVAVLGPRMDTSSILSDRIAMSGISSAGASCVNEYINARTEDALYELSSGFSASAGLETSGMKDVLSSLRKDHKASMCMLGNSIFTNADEDKVRSIVGDAEVFTCHSSAEGPKVIRRA